MKFILIFLLILGIFFALLPQVAYVIMKLLGWLFHFSVTYRPYGIAALVLIALWLLLFGYGNLFGRFHHEVKRVNYTHTTLPQAFEDYRIVHISDLHLDGWRGHSEALARCVDIINAEHPDLICFTGDLVSLSSDEVDDFLPILQRFHATDGVVSVLGNHDYLPYSRQQQTKRQQEVERIIHLQREKLHWQLLLNEHLVLRRNGDSIAILGCENQSVGAHPVIQRGDLSCTMQGTDSLFRILLTHDPSQWRKEVVGHTAIPLTLSGHTHAMQLRIAGYTPSRHFYPECDGLYTEGAQSLYVNIGLGGTLPMRIGATPEITVITLHRE